MEGDHGGDREVCDPVEEVQLVLDVQVVGRFVQQEFAGFLGQSAGDLGALAFAAGEGVPGLGGAVGEAGAFEGLGDGVGVGGRRR